MADVCESCRKLISAKPEWTWSTTYQKMFDKAKPITKEDVCMKFYDETIPLYINKQMPSYKQEGIQDVRETKHQIIAPIGPFILQQKPH